MGLLVGHAVAPLRDVLADVDGVLLIAHAELALHRDSLIGQDGSMQNEPRGVQTYDTAFNVLKNSHEMTGGVPVNSTSRHLGGYHHHRKHKM